MNKFFLPFVYVCVLILALFYQVLPVESLDQSTLEIIKSQMEQEEYKDTSMIIKKFQLLQTPSGQSVPRETKYANDSLAARPGAKQPSVYQDIINRNIIKPDSVLKTLEIFGLSVFQDKKSLSFEPEDQVSVPSGYVVAPGDEVVITLWGRINEEVRKVVNRDGMINIPRIGPVSVAGQTFDAMQSNLTDRIQNIEGVQASVGMGALRSIRIFIVGEVSTPGQYTVSALTNVTNALFYAGGVTNRGSLRNIKLIRDGRTAANFDFYDFLMSGNNFNNIRLKSGDVIFVPVVKKMAAIAGNVRRSALYELKGDASLKNIISLAGGLTPAAWFNKIQVERLKDNDYNVALDIEIPSIDKLPDFQIEDGDLIKIFPVVEWDKNVVFLSGNVKRPGKYEFKEGVRVSDIIKDYEDLLPGTYLDYAIVNRKELPNYSERIIPFVLKNMLGDPQSVDNLPLQPRDTIIIYHRDFFEPDRFVSIDGAVTTPGTYQLLTNMRIKDLILQAGGLKENASIERGELYRREFDGDSVRIQKIPFCTQCSMADDPIHNMELEKMDYVFIRKKQGWEDEQQVYLGGEFVFPGTYIMLEGETLHSLISRAGGFTPDAYLSAGIFTRQSVKILEKNRNEQYIRTLESDISQLSVKLAAKEQIGEASQILQHQMMLLERLKNIEPIGRVVIDLNDEESFKDFILEDGDSLIIPKRLNTISVLGEVFNPSTFQFNPGRPQVKHYVSSSGGIKPNADKKNIYVITASGSVVNRQMQNVRKHRLSPGDVVVVPQKIMYTNAYRIFIDTIDAVYKIALTAAVVTTILRR